MRAVLCNGFHGIKALSIGEAAEPRPGADEVLIDVYAACASFADYLLICGGYQKRPALPYVPGMDAAGVVVACGENVQRFRDRPFSEVVVPMRDVRSWEKTGSGQRWGEPTRLTQNPTCPHRWRAGISAAGSYCRQNCSHDGQKCE